MYLFSACIVANDERIHQFVNVQVVHHLSGIPFESMFSLLSTLANRQEAIHIKILKSRFNTDLRQHFFSERVINFWNSLNEFCISNFSQYLQAATQAAKTSTTDGSTIGHLLSADPGGRAILVRPPPVSYPVSYLWVGGEQHQ